MLMQVYSVKDEVVDVFFQPFFAAHDIIAIRMFQAGLKREDNLLRNYPNDYALYRIGTWAEKTGKVIPENPPVRLGYVRDFLVQDPVLSPDNDAKDEDSEDEPG